MRKRLIALCLGILAVGSLSIALLAQDNQAGERPSQKQNQTPASQLKDPKQEGQKPKFTPSSPEIERRDQAVTEEDIRILRRADEILADETKWNRNDTRICKPDDKVWSLFCALQKASIEILGDYDHRRVALQEVRFSVEDETKGQEFEHRLRDYNNLPSTQFKDIKRILKITTDRIAARLKTQKKST
jgi:hypothetical protein